MATTTATITLSSTDLLSDELALTTTATLTKAGTSTGLVSTTGLGRTTTESASQYTLFAAANYTDDGANKVYLKNTHTTAGRYVTVHLGDIEMGRLYAGDWAFFPWNADTGTTPDADVLITPDGSSEITLEHMLLNQ